jgi:sucrose-6-phosphate hydrolase SacC (GH32 family)
LRLGLFSTLAVLVQTIALAQTIPTSLHFKPTDHVIGDVHPYFRDGECFLYYLRPSTYDVSLVRSRDLLNWSPMSLVHQPETEDAWMRPYYVLGIVHDQAANLYRSFYGYKAGQIVSSASSDLIHWSCGPKEINIPPQTYYERRRDPYVFWIQESKSYGCVMTTWIKGMPMEKGGAISFASSTDLKTWTDHGPIVYPQDIGEPECPQMFKLSGRWYLLASIYDHGVGRPVYWTSESPTGPWSDRPQTLEGKDLCAAQVAASDSQLMLLGWIPLGPSRPEVQTWGGHLALPREVIALENGKLGVRLASSIQDKLNNLPYTDLGSLSSTDSPTYLNQSWTRASLRFDYQIQDSFDSLIVHCEPLGQIKIGSHEMQILDSSQSVRSQQDIELPLNSRIPVHIIIEDDIIELFVADSYSLVARLPKSDGPLKFSFSTATGHLGLTSMKIADWHKPSL